MRWFGEKRVEVPTVLQAQMTECGVAALGSLLAHFGRRVSLEELRAATGVSRDGSNAKIMMAAARRYGVDLKAVLAEPGELAGRGLPLICTHCSSIASTTTKWPKFKCAINGNPRPANSPGSASTALRSTP